MQSLLIFHLCPVLTRIFILAPAIVLPTPFTFSLFHASLISRFANAIRAATPSSTRQLWRAALE